MKIFIILFLLSVTSVLWAVTPMEYYNSLVAGDDDPGFKDGAFDDARFNQPSGLAIDEEGKRLFVADTNNNRIRVIYLQEDNRVETLAGTGDNKNQDGSLDKASFSGPCLLARMPEDQLAVYESGDHSIRILDLKNKSVSTIVKGLGDVWNLAYWPTDQGLYLSTPNAGTLQRLDIKNKTLTKLLANDTQASQPKALGVFANKLYVSDDKTSVLYQVEPVFNSLNAAVTVHLEKAGAGKNILQLAASGENLYALQNNSDYMAKVLPDYNPVVLATSWGFTLKGASLYYDPIFGNFNDQPFGFAAMPGGQKKFFVSPMYYGHHLIISVKDYNFGPHWQERNPAEDFEYPPHKPAQTFRIFVVGASRVVTAPAVLLDENENEITYPVTVPGDDPMTHHDNVSPRTNTFPKQLELLLNTEAALDDVSEHFEVMAYGIPAAKVQFFAADDVPLIVKNNDIDLILVQLAPEDNEQYDDYYWKPLTKDGIPSRYQDSEFLLKPWRERIPDGAPKRLLDACFKDKLTKEISPTELQFGSFEDLIYSGDGEIWNDLLEMLGKPLNVLNQRIGLLKTSSGKTPKVIFFYVPDSDCQHCSQFETFWSDACAEYGLTFLNLTKPYNDLKMGYYPTTEACCHQHYTDYGCRLIATILQHELINKGWIPFEEKKD
jgi:hypothetical protein